MMSRSSVGCAERRTCSSMGPPCGFDGAGRRFGRVFRSGYARSGCRYTPAQATFQAFQPVGHERFGRQQGRPQEQEIPPEPLAAFPGSRASEAPPRSAPRQTGIPRCWPPRRPAGPSPSGRPRPGRRCWPPRPCRRWSWCRRAARRTPAPASSITSVPSPLTGSRVPAGRQHERRHALALVRPGARRIEDLSHGGPRLGRDVGHQVGRRAVDERQEQRADRQVGPGLIQRGGPHQHPPGAHPALHHRRRPGIEPGQHLRAR